MNEGKKDKLSSHEGFISQTLTYLDLSYFDFCLRLGFSL